MDPPASGLFTEVSFRRLLASCIDIAAGDCKGREDLQHWKTSIVFHHYIETLQEQLADLGATGRVNEEVMQSYTQQVTALSDQLHPPELPSYCTLAAAAIAQKGPTATTAGGQQQQTNKLGQMPMPPPPVAAIPTPKFPSSSTGGAVHPPVVAPIHVSDAAKARLEQQGRVHENLTEELAGMAASLKASTLAINDKLKERDELLDKTEDALDKSLEGTKTSAAAATKLRARGRMNFCLTCIILLTIGVGFAAMYMFIRVTSFTGYKASKIAAPVPVAMPHQAEGLDVLPQHEDL